MPREIHPSLDPHKAGFRRRLLNTRTHERFIGLLPSVSARWRATSSLSLSAYYGRLFSGKGHRQLGQRDLDSVILMASLMF